MEELPNNWDMLSHLEKEQFFARYYYHYIREGEPDGLQPFAPLSVQEAYAKFLKEQ